MARTELPDNRRIILTTLVGIADQQCNRSARGTAFVDAGENLDFIGLTPRRGMTAPTGSATLQVVGKLLSSEFQSGGQPSITQPMAGPCDSPKVVTASNFPNVFAPMNKHLNVQRQAQQYGHDEQSTHGIQPQRPPFARL